MWYVCMLRLVDGCASLCVCVTYSIVLYVMYVLYVKCVLHVGCVCMYACVCKMGSVYACAEARGGSQAHHSITVYLTLLKQDLSLKLKLGWQPSNPSDPFVPGP